MINHFTDGKTQAVYLPVEKDRMLPPTGQAMGKLKPGQLVWTGKRLKVQRAAGNSEMVEIYHNKTYCVLGQVEIESVWTRERARSNCRQLECLLKILGIRE